MQPRGGKEKEVAVPRSYSPLDNSQEKNIPLRDIFILVSVREQNLKLNMNLISLSLLVRTLGQVTKNITQVS